MGQEKFGTAGQTGFLATRPPSDVRVASSSEVSLEVGREKPVSQIRAGVKALALHERATLVLQQTDEALEVSGDHTSVDT